MATAKNFYKLWNKSFYDTHPPFYSWLIKKFKDFDYYKAGVIVSLLCSFALYTVGFKLFTALGLTSSQRTIALTFMAFNYTLIYYSNKAFRYQLIVLLGTMLIYFLTVGNFWAAGFSWGLLGLTCVYAGLRGFWIWGLLGLNVISLNIYALYFYSWIAQKLSVYKHKAYYPSGIDGKIEPMWGGGWKTLISPLYFPWTYAYYGKRELGYDFKSWFRKISGIFGLYHIKGYNKINLVIKLLTGLLIYFTIKGMLVSDWRLTVLTLILLYPSILKRFLPRNSIIAIPLVCYFLAKGLPPIPNIVSNLLIIGSTIAYLWFNRVFCIYQPKIKARVVSNYLNDLPKDGVLVEGLIAYPIAYRSNKRVVVIPHDPDTCDAINHTDLSIKEFNLNYAVFSDLYKTEEHLGYPAIEYIKLFRLIKTIREDGENYYVYELFVDKPQ